MEALFAGLVMVALFFMLFIGITSLFWLLWCTVLPAVYPTGPEMLIKPSFWMFVGIVLLLRYIASMFHSNKD